MKKAQPSIKGGRTMNPTLIFDIVELATSLADGDLHGHPQQDRIVEETLLEIIRKGTTAYEQHTGEALDPSLLHAEEPL